MTALVANVEITNTFDYWRQRTNEIAYAVSNLTVTVDSNTAIGNAAITGKFSANTIFIGGSTANIFIVAPTSTEASSKQHYLNANGAWAPNPAYISSAVNTVGTGNTLIDSYDKNSYSAAEYVIRVKDTTVGGNNFLATKVLTYHDGYVDAYAMEYATIFSNNLFASFSANANTTHVRLYVAPTVANTTINFVRISASI